MNIETTKTQEIFQSKNDEFLSRYHNFMKNPDIKQEQFAKGIFNLISTDKDTSYITTIAARCGIGKSQFVKTLISFCTQHFNFEPKWEDSIGMVIVTDNLERLNGYQEDATNFDVNNLWGTPEDYQSHKQYCAYISSESKKPVKDQLIASKYKPIVLITTQRYFEMDDEEREQLFSYKLKSGNKSRERKIVIFDEKPYFYNLEKITIGNFESCSAALQDGIYSDDPDKDWLLTEYRAFRDKMANILRMKEKEESENIDRFYWKDKNTNNLTSNDKRFFELLHKHRKNICKVYPNAMQDFKNFKSLMKNGAFFVSQKQGKEQEYQTYFELYQDNSNKFYLNKNKAKFFIFDATADIDPDYQRPYVRIKTFPQYNADLHLNIINLDVNTSKAKLINSSNKTESVDIIKAICQTIKEYNQSSVGGMLIVTYQQLAKEMQSKIKSGNTKIGYFGNLKGTNDFIEIPQMFHIGLNRYSDFAYFIKYLSQRPEILKKLKLLSPAASRRYMKDTMRLDKGLFIDPKMNQIMMQSIFADFEQNIFRTAIRDYNNKQEVCIYTYWNTVMYGKLNQMIEKRYQPYGAKVKYDGVPLQIQELKTLKRKSMCKTNPQKIIEWYNSQPKGRVFKIGEMLKEINLNRKQFERTITKNQIVRALFEKCKRDKKGYYEII